jgi:hypothetical protein
MPYAILMNELKPLDLKKTASILAKAEYLVYADATRSVRNCCGILARNLSLQEAKSISDELNRAGVGVFYMDQGRMYHPERASHINDADCLEQHFNVQDIYGRSHPLSWSNITLLSLGRIVERKQAPGWGVSPGTTTMRRAIIPGPLLVAGAIAAPPPESGSSRKTIEEEHFILDIFARAPQEQHYRIEQKAFNYDYLGHRLRASSGENFRLFIEDLVRFAKNAYGNRGINAYLAAQELEKLDYYDLDHFDDENLWLLQLIHTSESSPENEAQS